MPLGTCLATAEQQWLELAGVGCVAYYVSLPSDIFLHVLVVQSVHRQSVCLT